MSPHVLAVLIHFPGTVTKWKMNRLSLPLGVMPRKVPASLRIMAVKKFLQMAMSIMNTVFSLRYEHGRCFHMKSLFSESKSLSLAPRWL